MAIPPQFHRGDLVRVTCDKDTLERLGYYGIMIADYVGMESKIITDPTMTIEGNWAYRLEGTMRWFREWVLVPADDPDVTVDQLMAMLAGKSEEGSGYANGQTEVPRRGNSQGRR